MKASRVIAMGVIGAVLLWGCAPQRVVAPPEAVHPGAPLVARAERFYQVEAYEQARSAFTEYVARYPQGPEVPLALLRLGAIEMHYENYAEARALYQRVVADYPESEPAHEAAVGLMRVSYREGRYAAVIAQAEELLRRELAPSLRSRVYALRGDAHGFLNNPQAACTDYALALEDAEPPHQAELERKLEAAAARLDADAMAAVLQQVEGSRRARGYMTFAIGKHWIQQGRYDDARRILERFVELFPEHVKAPEAQQWLERYREQAVVEKHTIGCLLPLSGPYAAYGRRALQGVEFAFAQYAATSGNPMLRLLVRDTASDPDRAVAALEQLEQLRVVAVIGPIATAEAAAAAAQQHGLPLIAITQKQGIPAIGDFVFRNFFTPQMQAEDLATYAIKRLGLKRFAILYPQDTYGRTFMQVFWEAVIARGGQVVGLASYALDQTDYADPIRKITGLYYEIPKDLEPAVRRLRSVRSEPAATGGRGQEEQGPPPIVDFDAVFIPDGAQRTAMLLPQLAFHDVIDVHLLGTNLWHSESLIREAGEYAQMAVLTDIFFAQSERKPVQAFVQRFAEVYGHPPGFIEAVAYDSARLLLQAGNQPGIQMRGDLRDALLAMPGWEGVCGRTAFGPDGEVQRELFLLGIKGDRFVTLPRAGRADH
jgi:ABC-type branched-subunit amino acid transport system substrate-binding protein/predicted negative regulator of RcsB-dependent stress response